MNRQPKSSAEICQSIAESLMLLAFGALCVGLPTFAGCSLGFAIVFAFCAAADAS